MKQIDEDLTGVEAALTRGADDTGEDLLGVGAAIRAIASTHFAVHHSGPERMFSAPVGRVNRRFEEEAEERGQFHREMRGEAAHHGQWAWRVERDEELREELPPSDGDAMWGDGAGVASITQREGVLENRLHAGGKLRPRMVGGEIARASQQMPQTGLMRGVCKRAIRCPAVAHEDAAEALPQNRGGVVEAAPAPNGVDGRVRRRKRPEPVRSAADFPTRFIRRHDGTAANGRAEGRVGRLRLARRAVERLRHGARRDREAKSVVQQRRNLAVREAQVLIENADQRDRLRAEMDGGGPQRI